jgi:hypothetical protein
MIDIINIAHAGVISDAPTLKSISMNILSFLLSVAGIVAIIALVVSGAMYFFSAGDENRIQIAKRSAKYAIVGIILAMGGMILIKAAGQFF